MQLQLVSPTVRHRESFFCALREFRDEGLSWWFGGDLDIAERDFAAFVAKKLADAHPHAPGSIPATHLWALSNEQFVGRLSIRHQLNDALRVEGGHIGYDTLPSLRGRGIATEMLRQALPIARAIGLTSVLVTCDDTNGGVDPTSSKKTAACCWKTKVLDASRPSKRYYAIAL